MSKIVPIKTDDVGRDFFLSSGTAAKYLEQEGFVQDHSGRRRWDWSDGHVEAVIMFRNNSEGNDEFYIQYRA